MTILDASALMAFLTGAPAADEVGRMIRGEEVGMTVENLAEVYDILSRVVGVSDEELRSAVDPLVGDPIRVVVSSHDVARRAGMLRAARYRRRVCELSMADCFLLAAARPDDRVATSDRAVLRAARAEGIAVAALAVAR